MNVNHLFTQLTNQGLQAYVRDGKLHVKPKGKLTQELRQAIARNTHALIELLERNHAGESPNIDKAGDRVWTDIDHGWTGDVRQTEAHDKRGLADCVASEQTRISSNSHCHGSGPTSQGLFAEVFKLTPVPELSSRKGTPEHETVCNFATKGSRTEAPQVGTPAPPPLGHPADVSLSPGHSRYEDVPSTPVKHTRRRALASTPPPHTGPFIDGQHKSLSFLYSVIRDGVVERGVFISQGIRSEPEALLCLRKRYPELRVQWARAVTHPVCGGCRFYTAAVLCNADRSPDYAASVGSCGKYAQAGEL